MNKKLVKEISLGFMMVLVGIFFWFAVHEALSIEFTFDTLSLVGWGSLVYALIAFCLLLGFIGLFCTLVKTRWMIYPFLFLTCLTPLVFFQNGFFSLFIIASCFLLLIGYQKSCQEETEARYKFSITRSTYFGQSLIVLILLVAVSLTYYVALEDEDQEGKELEQSIVSLTTDSLNKLMEEKVDGYDPNMTLDDWLGNIQIQDTFQALPDFFGNEIISSDLEAQIAESAEYQQILSEAEEEAKGQAISELRNQFLSQFEIEAKGTDTINSVLEKFVSNTVGNVVTPYSKFIRPVLAISLLLVLRLLTPLYIWLTRFFQWLIIVILKKSKFIIIEKGQKEAEIVKL